MAKGSFKRPITLSQCMIVRNEEANIEQALSWGRGIAFEQIVVDTGSTDATVALAEKLGAKVFHFEWINDFSAAKNFAISKARGDWIAFLDADEYFTEADAAKIPRLIQRAEKANTQLIRCPLVNVDDQGVPFSIKAQDRIFKNDGIRYKGNIHEQLSHKQDGRKLNGFPTEEITIIHTGYKSSVYASTNKLERNIALLREELSGRPDDAKLMIYLADSLKAKDLPESIEEAKALYEHTLGNYPGLDRQFRKFAYNCLLMIYLAEADVCGEYDEYVDKALAEFPDSPFYTFCRGCGHYKREEYGEAMACFMKAESLMNAQRISETDENVMVLPKMYAFMAQCANILGDKPGAIKYMVLSLKANKDQSEVLSSLITFFAHGGESDANIMEFLGKLYDFADPNDLLFAARAAKNAGTLALAKALLEKYRV